jgi:hypothetical protein
MFAKIAQIIKDAGLNPHVRTEEHEILVRDGRNQLYIITVRHVGRA